MFSDLPVEVGSFENERSVTRFDDAALDGDGTRCVDVVPRHHPYGDSRPLAFHNSVRYLQEYSLENLKESSPHK